MWPWLLRVNHQWVTLRTALACCHLAYLIFFLTGYIFLSGTSWDIANAIFVLRSHLTSDSIVLVFWKHHVPRCSYCDTASQTAQAAAPGQCESSLNDVGSREVSTISGPWNVCHCAWVKAHLPQLSLTAAPPWHIVPGCRSNSKQATYDTSVSPTAVPAISETENVP